MKCNCGWKREYGSTDDPIKKKYYSPAWKKIRQTVRLLYGGIDPYALAHGRIEHTEVVHHIVPTDEDPSRFCDPSNVIPLSKASHREVHMLYSTDEDTKRKTQDELSSLLKEW